MADAVSVDAGSGPIGHRAPTTLHLVRHGEAAAGWGADADPGLSPQGLSQVQVMADQLEPHGPVPIVTSPLRRARETAAALEARWNVAPLVEPGVGEIPSPSDDLAARQAWLQDALRSTWPALGPRYESWRTMVVDLLLGIRQDTVVVSHFVLINVVIGAATGSDAVVSAPVGNAAVVRVQHDGHRFTLLDDPRADTAPGRIL